MLLVNIKTRHINCFLQVALLKSLAKAADALFISIPAVSRAIQELETLLNTTLFIRTPKGMVLTDEGRIFSVHANKCVLELNKGIVALLDANSQQNEHLDVGGPDHIFANFLPRVVQHLTQTHKQLKINAFQAQDSVLYDKLKKDELSHIIVRAHNSADVSGLRIQELFHEPVALVARTGHPLSQYPSVDINLLEQFQLLLPPQTASLYFKIRNFLGELGYGNFSHTLESNSLAFAKELICSSDAVWFVPTHAVASELACGRLQPLNIDTGVLTGTVALISAKNIPATKATQLFTDYCRTVAESLTGVQAISK